MSTDESTPDSLHPDPDGEGEAVTPDEGRAGPVDGDVDKPTDEQSEVGGFEDAGHAADDDEPAEPADVDDADDAEVADVDDADDAAAADVDDADGAAAADVESSDDPASADDAGVDVEAPSGPPAIAVTLASIAVIAVVVGLVFAVLSGRTPAAYTFDGEGVSRAEAAERIEGLQPGLGDVILDPEGAAPDQLGPAREQLNFEIVYSLLQKAADERGVEVTDADVVAGIREFLAPDAAPDASDEEVLEAAVAATGATEERIRRETEANLIYDGIIESADLEEPTDAEVQAAYDSGQFPELSTGGLNVITTQTQEEIDAAFEQLESGEPFAAVAAQADPNYPGPQRPFDSQFLPEQLQEAVDGLEEGDYTEPVELQDAGVEGFAILQIVGPPPFDEVADTIREQLASQAQNELLSSVISETEEATDITVDPVFGEWVNGQGIVPPDAAPLGQPAAPPLVEDQ